MIKPNSPQRDSNQHSNEKKRVIAVKVFIAIFVVVTFSFLAISTYEYTNSFNDMLDAQADFACEDKLSEENTAQVKMCMTTHLTSSVIPAMFRTVVSRSCEPCATQ